ncbi:NAD(P)-dependent oxidoreductase [Taibaiella sp. KBW10]|uniref:NmrA family NAD(P)-binding protein n=1 Tax=Taibaiella sp. KBW10 TaxID=2153357 RepID=UPI000F59A646|nr:NmrA family NAD(P)-binding protein [Taibaiella sp. KBW10]RQO30800.1 NAD(P)-dependent oxidoreductase [Taibaiella sp. KBW10]
MRKILITGATGGLGGAVVNFLKSQVPVSDIAILARNAESEQVKAYQNEGIGVKIGTYDDKNSLIKAFTGIDILYFVSGNDIDARMAQHEQVVSAAKEAGVKHILYTSTVRKNESAAAPLYPVVSTHVQTEEWIKASGMTYTILRHNLYAEVILMFLGDQLLQTKSIFLPTGDGKTSFVVREDFAQAEANIIAQAAQHENKIYELNGTEQLSFAEIGTIIAGASGTELQYTSPDVTTFTDALSAAGLPSVVIDTLSQFSQAIAAGEFDTVTDDLARLLGKAPQSVSEFLKNVYSK